MSVSIYSILLTFGIFVAVAWILDWKEKARRQKEREGVREL